MTDRPLVDVRLRTRIPAEELEEKVGKILTDEDYNLLLTGDTLVRKPDGSPLAVYRRGVVPAGLLDAAYPILHEIGGNISNRNRGMASGTKRVGKPDGKAGQRTNAAPISSVMMGAFDRKGPKQYCRLTAWTGQEAEKFDTVKPLLRFIGDRMRADVGDRWKAQMGAVRETDPAWVIEGTPFTTITVNNTYPTGVHTDKGDLDAGFSNLTVLRRGEFTGGRLTFPEYRVAVDMQEGDLLLMNAHDWHGNTALVCACGKLLRHRCRDCGAERISLVCYFRTRMVECGSIEDERVRELAYNEQRNAALVGE